MVAVLNGQNGKTVARGLVVLGLGLMALIGFGMTQEYNSSINYKTGDCVFSKNSTLDD